MFNAIAQRAENIRVQVSTDPDCELSHDLGQHFTPLEIAQLAASLFSPSQEPLRCLDLGLGSGMLSACLFERLPVSKLVGVEIDGRMAAVAREALAFMGESLTVMEGDALQTEVGRGFDVAILNPPYKKMSASDARIAALPVKTPNLYAAFICRAIESLRDGGEMVAIVPRSWMNGRYFTSFRSWLYKTCSIDRIHVFDQRKGLFCETNVLQEIMLIKCTKGTTSKDVIVSSSVTRDHAFSAVHAYRFDALVEDASQGSPMQIAPAPKFLSALGRLEDLGLRASTGKVVDFRIRERLCSTAPADGIPLIYPCNLRRGEVEHPVSGRKPQWLSGKPSEIDKWAMPAGYYVLVKRFSAKEEARRVVASVLYADKPVAVENHLNVIHAGTSRCVLPMERALAEAVAAWLNTSYVDEVFRSISGNTQVNAGDLNALPFPLKEPLMAKSFLGAKEQKGGENDIEQCFG